MDHSYIEEHGLIERYHRGLLPPEEEIRFEEHFVTCPRCMEQLELARGFQRGLRTMVAEDAARTAVQAGIFAWLARRRWLAVAMLLVAAALPVLAWLAGSRGAREAVEARWRQLYESEQRSAADLRQRLEESERRRSAERRELESRLAQTPALAAPPAQGLQRPLVNTSVFLLTAVRSEPGEPAATIQLAKTGDALTLAVDAGDDPGFESYRITVAGARGNRLFQQGGLQPNALEALMITFPASFFAPGDYRLSVAGLRPDGAVAELGTYPFRVIR